MRTGPGGVLSPVNEQPSTPNEEPERPITLVDSTVNRAATPSEARTSSIDLVDTETGSSPQPDYVLERRWTKQSLQRQLTHRKYAQYQEHRLIDRRATERDDSDSLASASPLPLNSGNATRLARLFARKKIRPTREQDTVIDVLYENQRGVITLGVPHFSSNSLLNFDPKPWTNAHRRTSPVNITNAQVPDPNWVWAWDSWYVDMSRDVDEQGWEYSFWFQDSAAWHGNHPWFHSFVRRRRWLRKRVRAKNLANAGEDQRTESPQSGSAPARPAAAGSVGALINAIKACSIDRERLVMIRAFLAEPNNDVHDLTDEVPHIVSLFVFQESRKTLVEILAAAAADQQSDPSAKRISQLLCATRAAQRQIDQLEYWSDVRSAAVQSMSGQADATDASHEHHEPGNIRPQQGRQKVETNRL